MHHNCEPPRRCARSAPQRSQGCDNIPRNSPIGQYHLAVRPPDPSRPHKAPQTCSPQGNYKDTALLSSSVYGRYCYYNTIPSPEYNSSPGSLHICTVMQNSCSRPPNAQNPYTGDFSPSPIALRNLTQLPFDIRFLSAWPFPAASTFIL